jgi:hypothetical protein
MRMPNGTLKVVDDMNRFSILDDVNIEDMSTNGRWRISAGQSADVREQLVEYMGTEMEKAQQRQRFRRKRRRFTALRDALFTGYPPDATLDQVMRDLGVTTSGLSEEEAYTVLNQALRQRLGIADGVAAFWERAEHD